MTMQSGASERSRETRSAARAHLLALREARLNRRRGRASTDEGMAASVEVDTDVDQMPEGDPENMQPRVLPDVIDTDSEDQIAIPTRAPESAQAVQPKDPPASAVAPQQEVADPPTPVAQSPEESTLSDVPEMEVEVPDLTDMTETEAAPLAEPDEPRREAPGIELQDAEDTAPQTESEDASEAENPLASLLGAGPGLVWMLNTAGITTIADLAAADKSELSRQLGLLGKILDLDYWIAQAQAQAQAQQSR